MVAPAVACVAALLIVVPHGRRLRALAGAVGLAVVAGGFWYLRNLLLMGSPVPALDVGVGPVRFPSPEISVLHRFGGSLATEADSSRWSSLYEPGLRSLFGAAWPVILGVAALGIVFALFRPGAPPEGRARRVLGAVGLLGVLAYTLTPGTGAPLLFGLNLRYGLPAVAVGLVLAGTQVRHVDLQRVVVELAVIVTIFNGGTAAWLAAEIPEGLAVAVAVVALVGVAVALLEQLNRRLATGAAALVAVAGLSVSLFAVADRYQAERYWNSEGDLGAAMRWALTVEDRNIGFVGTYEHYGFYGADLSNHVEYIGFVRDDGSFHPATNCREFRGLINEERFTDVVIANSTNLANPPPRSEMAWMTDVLRADEVVRAGQTAVFHIDAPLDLESCPPGEADLTGSAVGQE